MANKAFAIRIKFFHVNKNNMHYGSASSKLIEFDTEEEFLKKFNAYYKELSDNMHGILTGLKIKSPKVDSLGRDKPLEEIAVKALVNELKNNKKFQYISRVSSPKQNLFADYQNDLKELSSQHFNNYTQTLEYQRKKSWTIQGFFTAFGAVPPKLVQRFWTFEIIPLVQTALWLVGGMVLGLLAACGRNLYLRKAKSYYDSKEKIEKTTNKGEQEAVLIGVDVSHSTWGYFTAFRKRRVWTNPVAFVGGVKLGSDEEGELIEHARNSWRPS